MSQPTPKPIVVKTVCSLCDLPWEDHGPTPSTADCVRLLKQELARRPAWTVTQPWLPYQYPYTSSPTYPTYTVTGTSTTGNNNVVRLFPPNEDGEPPMPVTSS